MTPLRISVLALCAVVFLGCSPERMVLEEVGDAAIIGPDSKAQDSQCTECSVPSPCLADNECALGSVCEGVSCIPCRDIPNICADLCASGDSPVATIRNGCAVCLCPTQHSCVLHSECPYGQLCGKNICMDCASVGDFCWQKCPPDSVLAATDFNGCNICECRPKSDCKSDSDCGSDGNQRCFPGLVCEPGYEGIPEYCYGNLCGPSDCMEPQNLPCWIIGCASGMTCDSLCPRSWCKCDPVAGWFCDETGCDGGGCIPPM